MSIGYDIACMTCRKSRVLGFRYAGGQLRIGYGRNEEDDCTAVMEFVCEHAHHELRVLHEDDDLLDGLEDVEHPDGG